jgi:hypothetical protein
LRRAAATYTSWLQQALAEPANPHTDEPLVRHTGSSDRIYDLVIMVDTPDQEMTEAPEELEDQDDEPLVGQELLDYEQWLLDMEGEDLLDEEIEKEPEGEPVEDAPEASEPPECYMSVQDPEPPPGKIVQPAPDCPGSSRGVRLLLICPRR